MSDLIKHMVDRFLGWRLPENFNPDGGISFKKTFNDHMPTPMKHEPTGTNVFDAEQATAMVRHMLQGYQPPEAAVPARRIGAGVLQTWVVDLPLMQQSVLLTAIRGPDDTPKYHPCKYIVRWFRRAVILSSFAGRAILNPYEPDGGSFYGPACEPPADGADWEPLMAVRADEYVRALDELPHHFQMHMLHAAEIVGYKHSDARVRDWWCDFYKRLCHDMHLWPETREQMDARLSGREGWLARADEATRA